MSINNNSFLTYLQDHFKDNLQLVDQIAEYLESTYGLTETIVFKHRSAPECYEYMGFDEKADDYCKNLIETNKNKILRQPPLLKISGRFVLPLYNHENEVNHILVIKAEKECVARVPSQCWNEISSLYKLTMVNEKNCQEHMQDKSIHVISRMAHDINALAALIPTDNHEDKTLCERIIYSQKLSEDIMVYLRDFTLQCSWYSARELIEGIFSEKEQIAGIKYRISFEDNLNYVNVDLELIEQAIKAIVENAETACQIEGNEIEVWVRREQNNSIFINNDWLSVSVRDDGPGIPVEYRSEVIKPFFTTWKEQGRVGLGLSIADKVIKAHGGSISIKSEPGQGTDTLLYLPLYDAKI